MNDLGSALVQAHERNIERYHRLLSTRLSDVERNYIESRILQERAALQAVVATGEEAFDAIGTAAAQASAV